MLADEGGHEGFSGSLKRTVHRPGEWLSSLIGFIAGALPGWRDDPERGLERSGKTSSRLSYAVI